MEGLSRCCNIEPGQGYFQTLAIADFSEMKGYRGSHFTRSPGFAWRRMQPTPKGAAARVLQYPRPVSILFFCNWRVYPCPTPGGASYCDPPMARLEAALTTGLT